MENDPRRKASEMLNAPRDQLRRYGSRTLDVADPNRVKNDPSVIEAFGRDFPIGEFVRTGIRTPSEIRSDARYANDRHARYGNERFRAKNLETIVRRGIVENGWLGEDFPVSAVFQTTKYDDYQNRCDFVVSADDLSFAVDVTYNSTKLQDKYDRPTNNAVTNAELPPGFGRVKYFDDGKSIGDERLPRFVIGLDYFEDEKIINQPPNSEANNRVRFKILSELFVQAKHHYETMLEDDPGVEQSSTVVMENLYYTFDESLRGFLDEFLAPDENGRRTGWQKHASGASKFENRVKFVEERLYDGDGVYKDTMQILRCSDKPSSMV